MSATFSAKACVLGVGIESRIQNTEIRIQKRKCGNFENHTDFCILTSEFTKNMAKTPNTIYVCQNCGSQSRKWLGRCPDCGEWNSYVEEKFRPTAQAAGKSPTANARFSADAFREVKP